MIELQKRAQENGITEGTAYDCPTCGYPIDGELEVLQRSGTPQGWESSDEEEDKKGKKNRGPAEEDSTRKRKRGGRKKRRELGDDEFLFQPKAERSRCLKDNDRRFPTLVATGAKLATAMDQILQWQNEAPNDKIISTSRRIELMTSS